MLLQYENFHHTKITHYMVPTTQVWVRGTMSTWTVWRCWTSPPTNGRWPLLFLCPLPSCPQLSVR